VTPLQLSQLLVDGEHSTAEFKREEADNPTLAKAMVALANLSGGRLLVGESDDGTVIGVANPALDERIVSIGRHLIRPPIVPAVEFVTDAKTGLRVAVVTVERGYAVHAVWHHNHVTWYVRAGRTSREVSPEEMPRLQQQRGTVRGELRAAGSSPLAALDLRRLTSYFVVVRQQPDLVPEPDDIDGWQRLLLLTELMTEGQDGPVCTVAAVALFGRAGRRAVPHARIDATAYPTLEKDYAVTERAQLRAPLAPLLAADGSLVEPGLADAALSFARRNLPSTVDADGARRTSRPGLPADVLREAIVNALVHRDYVLGNADVELGIYPDRVEVISPGRLPNGVTVEAMLTGVLAARNELIKDVMQDLGYVEHLGLGVPRKIVAGMRAWNGTEPEYDTGVDERVRLVLRR